MKKQSLFLLRASFLIFTLVCCSQSIFAQLACGAGEISYDQTITYAGADIEQNHTFDFPVCPGWDISDARITVVAQGDIDGDSGQDESWAIGTEFAPSSFDVGNGGAPNFQCTDPLSAGPFSITMVAILDWKADGVISFTATATDNVAFGICFGNDLISVRLEMCYSECVVAPVANCQDATVNLGTNGQGSIIAADVDNGSTASCSDLNIALAGQQNFTCADIGQTFSVTLNATDDCGNSDDCTATISVEDNVAPTITCTSAGVIDVNTDCIVPAGSATAYTAMITDNCTALVDLTQTLTDDLGNVLNVSSTSTTASPTPSNLMFDVPVDLADGIYSYEVVIEDAIGNTDNCTFNLSIADNSPDANCKDFTVQLDADGMATVAPADVNDGSTDNCTDEIDLILELDQTEFDCSHIGSNSYNFTVTDEGGSSSVCSSSLIIVEDNVAPDAVCQDVTVNLDEDGNGSTTAEAINNNSTDACGIASLSLDITDFTCDDTGDNTVTLTVTDNNGNPNTCPATVTVADITPPVAVCQDRTIQLDADGNGTLLATDVNNGSTDACGITSFLIDLAGIHFGATPTLPFTCGDVGTTMVTLFAVDAAGNADQCTANITIEDNVAPEAICMDAVVLLDNDGLGSINTDDIDNGSNDACGIASLSLDITEFDCSNVGDNGTVLTVTDVNNNVSTCNAVVTVQDLIPAEIECRQPISTTTSLGLCIAQDLTVLEPFSIYDNCGAENVTFTRWPAGNDFSVGETELNWTATDANGNTSTCQSLVIITDGEFPTVSSCNTAIDFVDPGSCLAQVTVDADVFDNCGIASVEGLGNFILPFGSYSNPITVTDVNGNVTVHDFTIYIHDDLAPQFQNCPEETIVLQAGADGTADYPAQTPVATDNCGVPTITNDLPADGFPMGSSVVTFTAEDSYGNTTDCVVNIEVTGGILLHPVGDIESSLAEDETTQTIAWNALNAGTICEICEETELEGFRYVGTWWGHQYFLADESSLTREEAGLIAEGYDAHLAVINDAAENAYLTEALDNEIRSAWIGLMPQLVNEEWTFAWDNGDVLDFSAINFEEVNEDTRIILGEDGTWKNATAEEDKYFLIERPCVNFVQTGPIYTAEVEENEGETPGVLLRSGDVWPQGEYEVTYALTDMCGNEAVMNFDLDVLPQLAEYCTTAGVENSVWVEEFVFHDLTNESDAGEGYTDFSEEATTMNIGDGVILVQMKAGGNEAEDVLYWNVYLDANADGDFFDAGEMLYQVASSEDIETNLTLPVVSLENARLRVMVSRYAFAAPCGDTYVGEIEDYTLNLLIPEDYARAACDVQVAGLNGTRSGFNVDLDWTVNSACPIENYTIEYSLDGVNFASVRQINETDFSDLIYTKDYTATLPSVVGTVIYRIKVQTADQAAFYTNNVDFRMNGKPNAPILHPNPADTYVKVALGKSVGQSGTVTIYDNLGKVRLVQQFDGNSDELSLNLQKFTDGIYHVSIQLEGQRIQTQRLVIDKLYGWSPAK